MFRNIFCNWLSLYKGSAFSSLSHFFLLRVHCFLCLSVAVEKITNGWIALFIYRTTGPSEAKLFELNSSRTEVFFGWEKRELRKDGTKTQHKRIKIRIIVIVVYNGYSYTRLAHLISNNTPGLNWRAVHLSLILSVKTTEYEYLMATLDYWMSYANA